MLLGTLTGQGPRVACGCTPGRSLRMQRLLLLSFLLLATGGLPGEATSESWDGPRIIKLPWWHRLGQPQSLLGSSQPSYQHSGTILTRDDNKCSVSVREQREGIALQVECTQLSRKFSCFFVGDPTSCTTSVTKKMIYWRQIAQGLRSQMGMCKDASAALSTRVCGRNFPESTLKLAYSTLINATSLDKMDHVPWWHDKTTTTTQPTTTTQTTTTTQQTTTKFDHVDDTDIKYPDPDIPFLPYTIYEDGPFLPYPDMNQPIYQDGPFLPYPHMNQPVYQDGPLLPIPAHRPADIS
ncbi:fibroblast growth factor-binding protein 1-like [Talpa occidentalis]|uniref:fibroblast growth factor-binding protein 1-like n=1 Tax=Talpa occidentalis TaxID=50954 RepID=UPI00188F381D|nr:fibroblast growth factor-binding protein 1-like [Talpa occidentalis]